MNWLAFAIGFAIGIFVVSSVHMLWSYYKARRRARRFSSARVEYPNVRRMKRSA